MPITQSGLAASTPLLEVSVGGAAVVPLCRGDLPSGLLGLRFGPPIGRNTKHKIKQTKQKRNENRSPLKETAHLRHGDWNWTAV